MADWFRQAFGVAAEEARSAIADTRSKLIDEAWFGRRVPEPQRGNDLGWSRHDEGKGREADAPANDRDHGIDR